jgi:cell filamentation protein
MHRDWLSRIYAWAGEYRTVELQKASFHWPPAFRVADNMETFERKVLARQTPCRPGPLPEVARGIAEVHAELLLIHPFREGNGRLARWLADLMSLQAGLPLPKYEFSGRGALRRQRAYLNAVTRGYWRDYEPLTAFFVEAISRRLKESGR